MIQYPVILFIKSDKISTTIDWILTEKCNLNCYYCLQNADTRFAKCTSVDSTFIKRIQDNTYLFHLTGGEPFLVPNLIELINDIQSQGHYVSMNTNLTFPTHNFAKSVHKERFLFINASYHYFYRKKNITPFVKHYMDIRKKGIFIYATIVMIPQIFDELLMVADMLISEGVFVLPKLMRGRTDGKNYPQNYDAQQLKKMLDLLEKSKRILSKEETELFAQVCKHNVSIDDWQIGSHSIGSRCFDGENYVRITENGDVIYCNDISIGNVYDDNFHFRHDKSKINCPYKTVNNLCKMNY